MKNRLLFIIIFYIMYYFYIFNQSLSLSYLEILGSFLNRKVEDKFTYKNNITKGTRVIEF